MNWSDIIPKETQELAKRLIDRAISEEEKGKEIYPPLSKVFNAFHLTPPDKVKVCIVGQDPYYTPNTANGLAFSVNEDQPIPPSLGNIYRELAADLEIKKPTRGDLRPWAERGVLLLNATLTVEAHKPNSHAGWDWDRFTTDVLRAVGELDQPVVYMLWGANAQKLLPKITKTAVTYSDDYGVAFERLRRKAYILSSHPSPLSVTKKCGRTPAFRGSRPFSKANELLLKMDGEVVDWRI